MNVLDYKKIEMNKISLMPKDDRIFLKYSGSPFRILTPAMITPFGVEEHFNRKYISLEFGIEPEGELKEFHTFFKNLDNYIQYTIRGNLISSIKNERHILLRVQLPANFIGCEFFNAAGRRITSFDITPGDKVAAVLEILNVWKRDSVFGINIVAKKIVVISNGE